MNLNADKVMRLLNEMSIEKVATYQEQSSGELKSYTHRDTDWKKYDELKSYVLESIHSDITQKTGGKSETSRRKAALKFCKMFSSNLIHSYAGKSIVYNGNQYIMDGAIVIKLYEGSHIVGLPEIEGAHVPKKMESVFNIGNVTDTIPLDEKNLLKAMATWNSRPEHGEFCNAYVGSKPFNVQYLLLCMNILGASECSIVFGKERQAIVEAPRGMAVIMPLSKLDNNNVDTVKI